MARNKFISPAKFKKLKIGDKVVIRWMIGEAKVASKPGSDPDNGLIYKKEPIDIHFSSGPWKGKTLQLCRQYISTSKFSFPR